MTRALSALSGVRRDAMARAPLALNQSATTGFLMVLTAIIASLTMGYALQRAFIGDHFEMLVAIGGGLLWGAFVLSLDRLLLMGIDKNGQWYRVAIQVLLRAPIAIVLGVAISKPLILRVSQTVLDRSLREEERSAVDGERTHSADTVQLDGKQKDVKTLEKAIAVQERRVNAEPDSFEYKTAQQDLAQSIKRHRDIENRNGPRIAAVRRQAEGLESSLSVMDHNRARVLRDNIAGWRGEISRAAQEIRDNDQQVAEVKQQWLESEKAKLVQVKRDHELAKGALGGAQTTVDDDAAKSKRELAPLMLPNLVNEYTTLKRIEATPNHPNARTLERFELSLDCLFILFELTPLLSKVLSRANTLDHAITAIEYEDEDRVNQESLAKVSRLEKIVDVSREVNDQVLEQWATAKLDAIRQTPTITPQMLRDLSAEIAQMNA